MKYVESLRLSIDEILSQGNRNILLGEDISDPYGGAFKVTKGLSIKYPDQIINTPISENGFLGLATGMAFVGFNPIIEIMFCDFITHIVDPIVNTASKLDWFSQGKMKGALVVRTPGGGGRGYGPIHSQSLEKIFFGWPNVSVFAPNILTDPGILFQQVFGEKTRVKLFIETKKDYPKTIIDDKYLHSKGLKREILNTSFPTTVLFNNEENIDPDFVICCYGGMVDDAIEASYNLLIDDEITTKLYIPTKISPIDDSTINSIASNKSKMIFVEEGYASAGWCSQLITQLIQSDKCKIKVNEIKIIGPPAAPIPANIIKEKDFFPDSHDIISKVRELI